MSAETRQDGATTTETPTEESIDNNSENAEHERTECNKVAAHKHGILQLLGESGSCVAPSQTPRKKKRRKGRESFEHSIVKQNQSSSFQPFDHTKRKTKKMAEMLDFLERERNVSLLNDICKSRFGGLRKKCKRNVTSSDKPSPSSRFGRFTYPFSSESVELDTYDIDTSPKQSDILHFYPNLRDCGEETRLKEVSEMDACSHIPTQESPLNNRSTSNKTTDRHLRIKGINNVTECDESPETKLDSATHVKNEREMVIEDNRSCLNEEDESPVLNLQISDIKGSAWIDTDGYTSDESVLVIDEGNDTRGTYFGEGGNLDSLFKKTKILENNVTAGDISIGTTVKGHLQISEFQSKSNVGEKILDSIVVDNHNSGERQGKTNAFNSSPIQIQSALHSDKIKVMKNSANNYKKSDNCYVIEVQEEVRQSGDSFQQANCLKDAPIRKIKLKKVDKKEGNYICDAQNISSSSSKRNKREEVFGSNHSSTDSKSREENRIIDVDNYIDTQKESSKSKPESNESLKSSSPHILCDASEQIVSSSIVDPVSSSKIESAISSNQCSSRHQQKETEPTEFTVLRSHLESGNRPRRYTMSRDPRSRNNSFSRVEPYTVKARASDRNNSNDNRTSESLFIPSDSDMLGQNPNREFNQVIYIMYRELLSPLSQNLIGQLTEILYLVISESVRYSDRCRKAKRLMSAELVIREQVLAHRDFQANTIFYGMYFTHLFKNVVQCFPATKEFHTFMYLALFVNLFRRLKSIYNVHPSYLHIARKLVASMLKANVYDDVIIFSAICKPGPVFETDFDLVSQLIDSFAEYTKISFSQETNYMLHVPQNNHNLQPNRNHPAMPNRNIIHPEFPSVRIAVAPLPVIPTQTSTKSQSQSVPLQAKLLLKEESHLPFGHRILPKNAKLGSPRDPRATSSELERRISGKAAFFPVAEPHTPVTQGTPTVHSAALLLSTPTLIPLSVPKAISTTTPAAIPTSNSTVLNTSTSIAVPRIASTTATTSAPMSNPTVSIKICNSGKSQVKTSPITILTGRDQNQTSSFHVWRPTAIRPRFRPIIPYYPPPPLFLNSFMIPPPTFGDNCS